MKKRETAYLAICLIAALILIGCALSDETPNPFGSREDTPPDAGSMDTLEGTAWVLISLNGSSPLAKTTITAQFAEGRVSGSAGCNSYQGSYAVEGSDLSIAELLWTEMACLDLDGFMEQESIYTDQLARATGYRIADDQLEIFSEGDRVLIYAPQPEEADVGLEGTTWSLAPRSFRARPQHR